MTYEEFIRSKLPLPKSFTSKDIAELVRDAYDAGYSEGWQDGTQPPPIGVDELAAASRMKEVVIWPEFLEDKQ